MKRKLINLVFVLSICSILTGCYAIHVGNMSGSASLDSPNFRYKKQNIFGEANATYILGIGGLDRQSLIIEAKKSMLKENPLFKNQALANVTVSYKTTNYFLAIVIVAKCIVSADIVEFGPVQTDFSQTDSQNTIEIVTKDNSSTSDIKSENKAAIASVDNSKATDIIAKNKKINVNYKSSIKIGDKVKIINYFSKPVNGKVLDEQNGDITVEYINSNNKIKIVKVLEFQVEKIE